MSGKLYVVGTPIGNLGDFSPRAIETLENVDFIAAEDTRVTLKLLNHFGIKKEMLVILNITKKSEARRLFLGLQTAKPVLYARMQVCRQYPTRVKIWSDFATKTA